MSFPGRSSWLHAMQPTILVRRVVVKVPFRVSSSSRESCDFGVECMIIETSTLRRECPVGTALCASCAAHEQAPPHTWIRSYRFRSVVFVLSCVCKQTSVVEFTVTPRWTLCSPPLEAHIASVSLAHRLSADRFYVLTLPPASLTETEGCWSVRSVVARVQQSEPGTRAYRPGLFRHLHLCLIRNCPLLFAQCIPRSSPRW